MNASLLPPADSAAPQPRALTAAGEIHAVDQTLRDMLCYLDTGVLLVLQGCRMDQYVQAFMEDLRRSGKKYSVKSCSLTELQAVYAHSPTPPPHGRGNVVDLRQESDTQRQVKDIIAHATREGASDIHFIGGESVCRIRIRVNGLLEDYAPLPQVTSAAGMAMRAAIYQGMCDVADETFKPHRPQDARMKESFVREVGLYGARVATRPLDKGQLMVLRLLTRRDESWTLEQLGYLTEQIQPITRMTENKHGIHIFAGATGSGKSTSLEVLISRVIRHFNHQLHVLTLENPPEYEIRGANQTPVINDDWEGGTKNAMRLDPDVMMIGEMRDLVSAQAAFRAALTGHGVWTTLHANDPFAILQRLDDLGLDAGLYGDASLVRGLIYQCLVPVLCPHCRVPLSKVEATLDAGLKARLGQFCADGEIYFRHEAGCGHCRKGLRGRSVIAEVVDPTQEQLDSFRTKGKAAARRAWVTEHHGITRAMHLARLIRQGEVDPRLGENLVCSLDFDTRTHA